MADGDSLELGTLNFDLEWQMQTICKLIYLEETVGLSYFAK